MNRAVSVADTKACVLDTEIVSSAVPPALIVLNEKLLEMVGLDRPTVSVSTAEQVWLTQDKEELVLVTLSGGDITAVLVTWLCAKTPVAVKTHKNERRANATKWWIRRTDRNKKIKEQCALNEFKKAT